MFRGCVSRIPAINPTTKITIPISSTMRAMITTKSMFMYVPPLERRTSSGNTHVFVLFLYAGETVSAFEAQVHVVLAVHRSDV